MIYGCLLDLGCIGLLVCVVGGCRFEFWCLCLTGCCGE